MPDTTPSTGMTPPPDVPLGGKDKALGVVGSVLGGLAGHGGQVSKLDQAIAAHHQSQIDQAQMHRQNAATFYTILHTGKNPETGAPLSPEEQQKYQNMYNAAMDSYQKLTGVNKQTKAAVQQTRQMMDRQLATKQQQDQGGQGGAPGAPQGGAAAGGSAPSMGPVGPPPAAGPPGGQPNPDPLETQFTAQDLQQKTGDARDRAQKEFASGLKIKEDQAKAEAEGNARIAEEKAKQINSKLTVPKGEPIPGASIGKPDGTFWYSAVDPQGNVVSYIQTGPPKSAKPSAFEEWEKNPDKYDEFLKEMTAAKQGMAKNASFGAVYSIYRMLDMAYKQNPELLPVVASLAPQVFKAAGMEVPPQFASIMSKVPLDQPLSPETGKPIGTSMPGAPTSGTRNQAQTAARVIPEIPGIRQQIQSNAQFLGPIEGRKNMKYLLGMVGSTGDPAKDRALSKLRTSLTFLASASARFHLNSIRAVDKFEQDAAQDKATPEGLQGYIDAIETWAKRAQGQERGAGETGIAPPPGSAPRDAAGYLQYLKDKKAANATAPVAQ